MKNIINGFRLSGVLVPFVLFSCTKVEQEQNPVSDPDQLRAVVVAEGQFGYGTGSLTTLTHDGMVHADVFRNTNNRPLGDVPQSLTRIGANYYVPVNNSGKIEVFDSKSFRSVETMKIESSTHDFKKVIPMYVAHLGGDSLVMTNKTSSTVIGESTSACIFILDMNHGTQREVVRRAVKMKSPSYQVRVINGKLFVAGTALSVFDLGDISEESCRIVKNDTGKSVEISPFSKLCVDKKGLLWGIVPSGVVCIDPVSEKVVNELTMTGVDNRWGSCDMDPEGRHFYFTTGNRVYAVDTEHPTVPEVPVITHDNDDSKWTTYHMGVSPENTIFLIRVLYGSVTAGRVFEYSTEGEIVKRYPDGDGVEQPYFRAGIFPHHIHFE